MVDTEIDENFSLASRNLPLVETMNVMEANVYEIVKREKLVVTKAALEKLQVQYTYVFLSFVYISCFWY